MEDILIRAACFLSVILLGYLLRRTGVFDEHAFGVLSKVVLKITLPATIVLSFAGKQIDLGMMTIVTLGLLGNGLYLLLSFLLNRRRSPGQRAFALLNAAGYNIGTFTLPFVQSFLGPMGVVVTSLFDTGNAFFSLGGAFSLASMVKDGAAFSWKRVAKKLSTSVPFLCYLIMLTLALLRITPPAPILSFAQIVGNANAFLAMLMIGVGFRLKLDRAHLAPLLQILAMRYSIAAAMAVFCWFLPFSLEARQTLVILVFSPVASAAVPFTGELKEDVGLASAINSMSLLCSIFFILVLLLVML